MIHGGGDFNGTFLEKSPSVSILSLCCWSGNATRRCCGVVTAAAVLNLSVTAEDVEIGSIAGPRRVCVRVVVVAVVVVGLGKDVSPPPRVVAVHVVGLFSRFSKIARLS